MDKTIRPLLIAVIAIVAIQLCFSFFQGSKLKEVQKEIRLSKANVESALKDIQLSRGKIVEMQKDLEEYKGFLIRTETNVEILNKKKELEDAILNGKIDSKVKEIKNELALLEQILKDATKDKIEQ
jgi:hypothetical protein